MSSELVPRITARIGSAVRRSLRFAGDSPRGSLWAVLAATAAMFVVALAALTAQHVDRWTRATRGGASMVVYLGDGVDEAAASTLARDLAKLPGVEHAEVVAARETATRLEQALGADASLLEGIDLASLPVSVEVSLAPGVRDVIAMSPTVRALRGTDGVDDIIIEDAGSERIADTLGVVRAVTWTSAALLAGLALLVALATFRLRFDRGSAATSRELAVAHLLGANPSYAIVPTAVAGAVHGALAATIALVLAYVGLAVYGDVIAASLHAVLGEVHVVAPEAPAALAFVALGAGLGLVGGGLAGASRAAR